jgi:nucleoside-diphosphate-sugar epimerase
LNEFELEMAMSTILVTGGSGFIGSHCILQLLAAGHEVRTTVRSLKREGDVRAMLKEGGAEPGDRLSFVAADLEKMRAGRKPSPAASTCCTWRRHCLRTSRRTRTN